MSIKVILGVTGSIAAYKVIDLAKALHRNSCDVRIVLSKTASSFISVLTLESLFPKKVYEYDDTIENGEMLHISLAKTCDVVLIAPASANAISKLANGIGDCLLSTLCLATRQSIVCVPAMNEGMWENVFVQRNVEILRKNGVHILGPVNGEQACGDVGIGHIADTSDIVDYILQLKTPKYLLGKKIVVTAGSTKEKIDPIRFLSNYSSGKMGYAIAGVARNMGANVTLISGSTALSVPLGINFIPVESAFDMLNAVDREVDKADVYVGVAAIADYRPESYSHEKMKKRKEVIELRLKENVDIIKYVKEKYPKTFCVGFAAETNDLEKHGLEKIKNKCLDMVAVNDVSNNQVFNSDYNEVLLLAKNGKSLHIPKNTKAIIATELLRYVSESLFEK
ncbi:bifunctional phosphopantothenoylcysteine decarboxylase/phosphopantothenate--cysteine ligase CoaBC [Candidatus Fokinia crypta]|uniref:Coenzyme A biosynthesis bifunctional protein CoaBC n=1 Tax=Candidatus Fokinia crypta TaxID=1920990 RepID=A0ABZ0UPY5_9RICK|nr:bifunctional phosphopantothenoylcysteine decarboxylase/phosphopantothenate--cysteine ligase CoaBC [Candidatus Fokinia cryptica]WPX97732.1 Coenzyme A biosynthesis bifunctional protein CoaBC [Candidatus Fokinia cryptica]